MPKKAAEPAVEETDFGQIVTMTYERTHTQTHRYRFAGDHKKEGAALSSVYIEKAAFPNPAKPPKTIRVGISFKE